MAKKIRNLLSEIDKKFKESEEVSIQHYLKCVTYIFKTHLKLFIIFNLLKYHNKC